MYLVFFAISVALGFFSVSLVYFTAEWALVDMVSLAESLGEGRNAFRLAFLGGTLWMWIIGAAAAIGSLFLKHKSRYAMLWAPVWLPLIYAPGVLIFFTQGAG